MSNYPLLREASSRSLGHGFLRTPERPLLQWTPFIYQWNPIHYTAGQPCLQANCLFRPSTPDHPHRMTRRPVTRMPRVEWNVSAGHPSKHWPRSTLLNFGTKSAESTTSLNFGTKSAESTTSLEKLAPSLARVFISLYVKEPYHNNACQPVKHTKM